MKSNISIYYTDNYEAKQESIDFVLENITDEINISGTVESDDCMIFYYEVLESFYSNEEEYEKALTEFIDKIQSSFKNTKLNNIKEMFIDEIDQTIVFEFINESEAE